MKLLPSVEEATKFLRFFHEISRVYFVPVPWVIRVSKRFLPSLSHLEHALRQPPIPNGRPGDDACAPRRSTVEVPGTWYQKNC